MHVLSKATVVDEDLHGPHLSWCAPNMSFFTGTTKRWKVRRWRLFWGIRRHKCSRKVSEMVEAYRTMEKMKVYHINLSLTSFYPPLSWMSLISSDPLLTTHSDPWKLCFQKQFLNNNTELESLTVCTSIFKNDFYISSSFISIFLAIIYTYYCINWFPCSLPVFYTIPILDFLSMSQRFIK